MGEQNNLRTLQLARERITFNGADEESVATKDNRGTVNKSGFGLGEFFLVCLLSCVFFWFVFFFCNETTGNTPEGISGVCQTHALEWNILGFLTLLKDCFEQRAPGFLCSRLLSSHGRGCWT